MTTIKQGLDLPILGSPEQHVEVARPVSRVALLGDDYVGMKPTMLVVPGDRVKQGQALFEDKKNPGVLFTSPASGEVVAVNRGAKRRFESIEVAVDGDDRIEFDKARGADPVAMGRDGVTEQLVQSGLWTALRTRPFGKVPNPSNQPHSIFVQAIDTNPLAADPAVAIGQRKSAVLFGAPGVDSIDRWHGLCLQSGPVRDSGCRSHRRPGGDIPQVRIQPGWSGPTFTFSIRSVRTKPFGTSAIRTSVRSVHCSRPAALDVRRVISLAGPVVKKPRLLETCLGASVSELIEGECEEGIKIRPISGSVLCGRTADGSL